VNRLTADELRRIDPRNVIAYLVGQGWSQAHIDPVKSVLTRDLGNDVIDVWVPLDPGLRDFAVRIKQTIEAIADVEDRDVGAVYTTLLLSADIVSMRIDGPLEATGTLPLDVSGDVFKAAKDLVYAAASSAIERRPVHPSRRPPRAAAFMHEARLGQTERGSYVVTVALPVPPVPEQWEVGQLFPELVSELPFGRVVSSVLFSGLSSVEAASRRFVENRDVGVFAETVSRGVSANLCEALLDLTHEAPLEVAISWSRARPPEFESRPVRFDQAIREPLERAAQYFREQAPEEEFVLSGWVRTLSRETIDQQEGEVTIDGMTPDGIRRVRVLLSPENYIRAVRAHETGQLVRVAGTLRQEGRRLRLFDPGTLVLV
jgi:hypothetical protein